MIILISWLIIILFGSIPAFIFKRKINKAKSNSSKNDILDEWKNNSFKKIIIIPAISILTWFLSRFIELAQNERPSIFYYNSDKFELIIPPILFYFIGYVSLKFAINNFEKKQKNKEITNE